MAAKEAKARKAVAEDLRVVHLIRRKAGVSGVQTEAVRRKQTRSKL